MDYNFYIIINIFIIIKALTLNFTIIN